VVRVQKEKNNINTWIYSKKELNDKTAQLHRYGEAVPFYAIRVINQSLPRIIVSILAIISENN